MNQVSTVDNQRTNAPADNKPNLQEQLAQVGEALEKTVAAEFKQQGAELPEGQKAQVKVETAEDGVDNVVLVHPKKNDIKVIVGALQASPQGVQINPTLPFAEVFNQHADTVQKANEVVADADLNPQDTKEVKALLKEINAANANNFGAVQFAQAREDAEANSDETILDADASTETKLQAA